MFEFVRNHARWMMGLILLLTAVAFLAPQGYTSFVGDAASTTVATVAGQKITQAEWDAAHRSDAERVRQQNPGVDAKLLDTPEAKRDSLEGLVQQRLLAIAAQEQHLDVGNERLEARFARDPNLGFLRTPNGAVNEAVLAAQGMTRAGFVERLRQDLRLRQVLAPLQAPQQAGTTPTATVAAGLAFDSWMQRRELRWLQLSPQAFTAGLELSDADVAAYYAKPATQKAWLRPEGADIEYLVLDLQALKGGVKVVEADVLAFYEQNKKARYASSEERRASHILLKVEDAKEEAAVKAKAEQLLAQVRKDPSQFAELARKNSQDEGSGANGGDLDFFARDAMVKPFADAAYALKEGEISPLVRSEFGFHIIQLTGVRGGSVRPFESVRAEIEDEQRTQLARQRYTELADQFSTLVFEQPDSLAPAAEKLGLQVQRGSVQRQPQPGASGALASPKLLEAVFGVEAVRNKRNTDAVETAASQLVSARVLQHRPAAAPPLAEVQVQVRQQLLLERAAELARTAGQARLKEGAANEEGLQPPQWVSRMEPKGLPQPVLEAALRADASKLPTLIGHDAGNAGYWLIKLLATGKPEASAMPPQNVLASQYAQAWSQVEGRAYVEALKLSHKVKLKIPAAPASGASAATP